MPSSSSDDWADGVADGLRRHEEELASASGGSSNRGASGLDPGQNPSPHTVDPAGEAGPAGPRQGTVPRPRSLERTQTICDGSLLGRIAFEQNLIDASTFKECLEEWEKSRRMGREDSFEELLCRRTKIGPDDLARLRQEHGRRAAGIPVIPRYEIRERLGEGTSALVFRAWDRELKREVALKVLREVALMSPVARERFRREAEAVAGLAHPNIVTLFDAGETGQGQPYLVLELIPGGKSLQEYLGEGGYAEREIVNLVERVARGVAEAHRKGIIHRDLKPANILLTQAGEPKVGDFGLAHLLDSAAELTRSGTTLGTPLYMSPEQVDGRVKDLALSTDVYALGAILYEATVGHPPHQGETLAEVYGKVREADPRAPRHEKPGIARDLETITLKALEKDPGKRYPSALEFADDLARYLAGEPIAARRGLFYAVRRRLKRHRAILLVAMVLIAILGSSTLAARLTRSRVPEAAPGTLWIDAAGSAAEFHGPMTKGKLYSEGSLSGLLVYANIDNRTIPPELKQSPASLLPGTDEGGWVKYRVEIPRDAPWFLWARLYYPGGGLVFRGAEGFDDDPNSFYVSIDGGKEQVLGNLNTHPQTGQSYFRRWHWDGNSDSIVSQELLRTKSGQWNPDGNIPHEPFRLSLGQLSRGIHILRVRNREALETPQWHLSPRLDMFCLTPDPTYVPRDQDVRR